jgi:hypothetical protein
MTRGELLELIRSTLKEYMGTGSSGGNSTDGNDVKSRRSGGGSFDTDQEEIDFYNDQNAGEGGKGYHIRGMEKRGTINPNRAGAQSSGGPRF